MPYINSDGFIVFFFITIVFGVIVAGCIYDSHKERDNEHHKPRDYYDTHRVKKSTTSSTTGSTTNYTRKNTEKNVTSMSSQKTIYAFRGKQTIHLCPFCDGENELEAKICNICGHNL